MAKYSTFKYGDGTKYGPADWDANLLWTFQVAWTGEYTGENEAERMVDLSVRRGRNRMLSGSGFHPMGVGTAVATLDNEDGRYDPLNASSPLYPNVSPGKLVKVAVKDNDADTNYGVMQGVIADIIPLDVRGEPHARIVVEDGVRWLSDKLTGPTTLEGDTLQTIAEWIVDDVGSLWPISADDSTLMTTETKAYWYTWKRPAYQDLRELADAEVGTLFHGRDGTIYLYNRDFTHNRTKAVTQAEILRDIVVPQPWEIIRNSIECMYIGKSILDVDIPAVVNNTLFDPTTGGVASYIAVADGETITIDATFKYQHYGSSLLKRNLGGNPERMAGYNVRDAGFSVSDTDLQDEIAASCTFTWQTPVGGGTRISITNNAGEDGLITGAKLNGDVLYGAYEGSRIVEDVTSQAKYGDRSLNLGSYWTEIPDTALAIATWVLAELKDPTTHPVIQFEARADYQFYFDLWDRVELDIDKLGIDDNFRVGSIEHQWLNPSGQAVRTTMHLEPYFTVFS